MGRRSGDSPKNIHIRSNFEAQRTEGSVEQVLYPVAGAHRPISSNTLRSPIRRIISIFPVLRDTMDGWPLSDIQVWYG